MVTMGRWGDGEGRREREREREKKGNNGTADTYIVTWKHV
jgi:hypothetical protein